MTRELIVNEPPATTGCDELRLARANGDGTGAGCESGPDLLWHGQLGPAGGAGHPLRLHFVVTQMRFVGTTVMAGAHTSTLRCA